MKTSEIKDFVKLWLEACGIQAGKLPSEPAIKLGARVLAAYELSEIALAVEVHLRKSRFVPVPADIIAIIEGELPADSVLVELAVRADTILGEYIAQRLGRYDLNHKDSRAMVPRMAAIRSRIEEFRTRALLGKFTDDEIRVMNSRGFNPAGELASGVPGTRIPFRQEVQARAQRIGKPKALGKSANDEAPSPEDQEKIAQNIERLQQKLKTVGANG